MSEIPVQIAQKRIKLSQPVAEIGTDLPGGSLLAKEIVDLQLRKIREVAKRGDGYTDPDMVRSCRDMMAILADYAKHERDAAKSDRQRTALESLTEDQLDEAIAAYEKAKK